MKKTKEFHFESDSAETIETDCEYVSYHHGASENDSYIVFHGDRIAARFYSRHKLIEIVGAGYARANNVLNWNLLEEGERRRIEPLLLTIENREHYALVIDVAKVDNLDAILEGE